MKVAIITDQHFGARKSSKFFHDYFKKFYDNVFFPYLKEHKITTIVNMGDTFDNRRNIDISSLEWAKVNYFDPLREMGITIHTVIGNHDIYYKNTNDVNSVNLLLKEYDNVIIYPETQEIKLGRLKILLVPWINQENEKISIDAIKKSKAK